MWLTRLDSQGTEDHHSDELFIISKQYDDSLQRSMAPPRKGARAKSERFTVTLGDDQRRKIAEIARQRRTSEATVVRWALDTYIEDQHPRIRERGHGGKYRAGE